MAFTTSHDTPLPLALTMGEPAGVGTEITLRAWYEFQQSHLPERPVFFAIDDPARLEASARKFNVPVAISTITKPEQAAGVFAKALPVLPVKGAASGALTKVELGKPSPDTAGPVIASIETAVNLALSGRVASIVTNPIQKKVLLDAGFKHPGHTEFLGALTASVPMHKKLTRGPVMMLTGKDLRVAPVTIHLPLRDVADALSTVGIINTAKIVAEGLFRDFGISQPKLAIAGLNPHAGEAGALGTEEIDIIAPAIEAIRELGIEAIGPLPADGMFHEEARQSYHAAITMYHDQGLIPIKAIAFHSAVNVTLGLPIIRTSPDHGTALDIAGKGVARADSLIAALGYAAMMAQHRAKFDRALAVKS